MNKVILVIDSGVGGISSLYALSSLAPNNYVYFADYANCPYGNKPPEFVSSTILKNISFLRTKYNVCGIVLACNTATALAIERVRQNYTQIPVLGVEPALNLALKSAGKRILLLATSNTIRYSRLVKKIYSEYGDRLILKAMPNLAEDIENNILALDNLYGKLRKELVQFSDVDSVVLGCTHYVFVKPILKQIFSSNVTIFDGNIGMAKQAKKVFGSEGEGAIILATNVSKQRQKLVRAWEICKEGICAE